MKENTMIEYIIRTYLPKFAGEIICKEFRHLMMHSSNLDDGSWLQMTTHRQSKVLRKHLGVKCGWRHNHLCKKNGHVLCSIENEEN